MSTDKKHRTPDEYLRYLKGEGTGEERHELERELESDPFGKEAMEGLEKLSPEVAEADIHSLHARLNERLGRGREESGRRTSPWLSRKRRIALYSAAAAVASFLIVGTIFLQIHDFNPVPEEGSLPESELPRIPVQEEPKARTAGPAKGAAESTLPPESESRGETGKGTTQPESPGARKAVEAEEPGGAVSKAQEKIAEDEDLMAGAEEAEEDRIMEEEIVAVEAEPSVEAAPSYEAELSGEAAPAEAAALTGEAAPSGEVSPSPAAVPSAERVSLAEQPEAAAPMAKRARGREARKAGVPVMTVNDFNAVSGVVLSSEDLGPLPGANILLKGGDTGVVADTEGRFRIPGDPEGQTTLIASFIGMETRECPVQGGGPVELVLKPDRSSLDEAVLVGHPDGSAFTGSGSSYTLYPNILPLKGSYTLASPSGGYPAYQHYIQENIRIPEKQTDASIPQVVLKFTVSSQGTISNIQVLRSPGSEFSDEAIRLLSEGPAWTPATRDSGPVDESVRLRIVFKK